MSMNDKISLNTERTLSQLVALYNCPVLNSFDMQTICRAHAEYAQYAQHVKSSLRDLGNSFLISWRSLVCRC